MSDLTANERGTVHLFGKPYHWVRGEDGVLRLEKGPAPIETNLTFGELANLRSADV
jgi:hypothetical protein